MALKKYQKNIYINHEIEKKIPITVAFKKPSTVTNYAEEIVLCRGILF